MKSFTFLSVALPTLSCLLAALPVSAQERTVGGPLANEASWNALKSMIGRTDGNVAILKTDVEAMKTCAAQKKLWLPGTGCVDAQSALYDKMVACGDSGMVYDKSANTCAATGSLRWRFREQLAPDSYYYSSFFPNSWGGPPGAVPGFGSPCSSSAWTLGACSSAGQVCYSNRKGGMTLHREGTGNYQGHGFVEIYQCGY